jgi:hypothetical protein
MLKIKDNVDLKELEKFGFQPMAKNYREHTYNWIEKKHDWHYEIYINKDRFIRVQAFCGNGFNYLLFANKMQTKLYDLIKADLVEKVDD